MTLFLQERRWIIANQFLCQFLNLHVTGQCLKKSTLDLLKFYVVKLKYIYLALICVLRAYVKKHIKYPLKCKIRILAYHIWVLVLVRHFFRCVSAPLDIKIKANPDKVDWLFLSYGLFIFPSTPYRRCK